MQLKGCLIKIYLYICKKLKYKIMSDIIKKEVIFSHPIDKVWNAISNGKEIAKWFINNNFKPEKGYNYTFTASEDKGCLTITGEVKQANPYTLIYTWIVQDTDVETTVKWELETTKEGTKLYLEHSGISNYEGENAVNMFNSFSGGWSDCINSLTNHLVK
jgi:uncharacterized protein YndB with AHSA1/START domain